MASIQFYYSKGKYKDIIEKTISKKHLSRYIKKKCEKREIYICYNFISKREQIKLNKEFKNHNYNTDILTFDLSENECELTGDVYISLKQIKKNAKNYNVVLNEEINRVLIHGFLHLSGYNDEKKSEKKEMRKQENKFLNYIKKNCSTWNIRYNNY